MLIALNKATLLDDREALRIIVKMLVEANLLPETVDVNTAVRNDKLLKAIFAQLPPGVVVLTKISVVFNLPDDDLNQHIAVVAALTCLLKNTEK